mgnify:CR=1 FL=1
MKMKNEKNILKSSVTIRGDKHYCPLPISIDMYSNCEVDCHHCFLRRLNHVWGGKNMKVADLNELKKRLINGMKNTYPRTPIGWALFRKKTIRLGNKVDPFQPLERDLKLSLGAMKILVELNWSFVIQTRFPSILLQDDYYQVLKSAKPGYAIVMPVISPGLDKDWNLLEKSKTDRPRKRMEVLRFLNQHGLPGGGYENGVNGEPFIPGWHTVEDFRDTVRLLKEHGIRRYNTYHLHANDYVYKRLIAIGMDIEKIWTMIQPENWGKILSQLLDIAKQENIILGCPDFVNSGWNWEEKANTCCGLDVPNPCTFNTHHWKRYIQQEGYNGEQALEITWDHVGDWETGRVIVDGTSKVFYTLKDIITNDKRGFGL